MKPTLPTCLTRQMTTRLVLFTLLLLGIGQMRGFAQEIFRYTNDTGGAHNYIDPNADDVLPVLGRGAGVSSLNLACGGPMQGFGATHWPTTNVFNVNTFNSDGEYITVTIDPNPGYGLKITGFSARSRRENLSGTADDGPIAIRYGFSTNGPGGPWTTVNPGNPQSSNLCNTLGANRVWPAWSDTLTSNPIIFRIYGLSSGGNFTGDLFLRDVVVYGEVCANAPSITIDLLSSDLQVCRGETSASLAYSATDADDYSIDYDGIAEAQGFADVGTTPLASAPAAIGLIVPAAALPGIYNGTLRIYNDCGFYTNTPFTVEVWELPTAVLSGDQTICAGDEAPLNVTLTGAPDWDIELSEGTMYSGIGIPEPILGGLYPSTSIVYTIVSLTDVNGCSAIPAGLMGSATVTVIPLPDVSATNKSICSGADTELDVTNPNAVGGTFNWTASYGAVTGGAGSGTGVAYGVDAINETLTNPTNAPIVVQYTLTPIGPEPTFCEGSFFDVFVTVDPIPDVSAANTTICSGAATGLEVTNPNGVVGSTFDWTADYGGVTGGAGMAMGVGFGPNAINEILVNNTAAPIMVKYTLFPKGPPTTYCGDSFFDVFVNVEPQPKFGFSASTTSNPAEAGDNDPNTLDPNSICVDFCEGDLLTLNGYSDNGDIGYTVVYTTTGNITYDGGALPLNGGPDNVSPAAAPGFFGTTYGGALGYELSSGTYGVIDQRFVPYLDRDGSGTFTPGDCEGEPVQLLYKIYAPIVVDVVRNDNNLCSGEMVDYTISTSSTQTVLFDLTLSDNPTGPAGTSPKALFPENPLPIQLVALSLTSASPYNFTQAINNAMGSFDRGRVMLTVSNVRYADTDVSCGTTINNPNPNTLIYPKPSLNEPADKLICTGASSDLDLDLLGLPSSNATTAGYPVRIEWTASATNVLGASNGMVNIYDNAGLEVAINDIVQVLTLDNPLLSGSVTYTITPRASGPTNGFNLDDCFGDPIMVTITVAAPSTPSITGPTCVHVGAQIQLTADNDVDLPATFVSGVWSSTPNVTLLDTFDLDTVLVTGYVTGTATIYYTVTDNAGCVSTAEYEVEVLEPLLLEHIYTGGPVACGEEFTVSVDVTNFCDINTLDYLFSWDISAFQLVSFNTPYVPTDGSFFAFPNGPNELQLSFADDGFPPYGVNVPDGTVVFTYTLRAVGSLGAYNIPNGPPSAEAYNSNFSSVPLSTDGVSIPIELLSLNLVGNPVICPSDPFIHLEFENVIGNPNYYVIDFDPLSSPPFPDIQQGTLVVMDGEIIIPTPPGIQNGSYQATLVVSNTIYGCESIEYLFSIIVDQDPPTASNPDQVNVACISSIPAPNINVVDDEDDNCPGEITVEYEPTLTDTTGTGCAGNPMIISRVYSVTDEAGNTTYVTQTITAEDNLPPYLLNPPVLGTWYQTEADAIAAAIAHANLNKWDNCTPPVGISVTLGSPSGPLCNRTIPIILVDACGNLSIVNYIVVIDGAAPTVTAGTIDDCYDEDESPTPPYFENEYAVLAAIAATTVSDDCDLSLDITATVSGTDCELSITVTATDDCGKSSSVTYETRVENDAPIITSDPNGMEGECYDTEAEAIAAAIDSTHAGDDCGSPGDLQLDADVSLGCPADITVYVTDFCGNFSAIVYTGVHIDTEDPQVNPDAIYATCFQTLEEAYDSLAKATHPYDNCTSDEEMLASVTVTSVIEVGDLEDECQEYDIEFTFIDNCGNTVAHTYNFIIIDNEDPTVEPLADLEYTCLDDVEAEDIGIVMAEDNCGVEDIVPLGTMLPTSCPGTGTRTYRVYDCAGNFTDVTQNIIVNDDVAPTWITTPSDELDRTISCDDLSSIAAALLLEPEAEDNCGEVTVTLASSEPLNTCAGGYVRTWTAVDDCGNEVDAPFTQVITIIDNVAPEWVTLPGALDEEVECDDPAGLEAALATEPLADDNCGDVSYEIVYHEFEPNLECVENSLGIWVTEWKATDDCGNTSTSFFRYVNIYDNTPPEWETEEAAPFPIGINVTISCSDIAGYDFANSLEPEASDNCDPEVNLVKITGPFVPGGDCPGEGSFTNTWTAIDNCGNVSLVFTQTITVVDNTPPTFDPGCQFMPLNLFTSQGADCHTGISLSEGDLLDYLDSWTVAGLPIPGLGGCIGDDCSPIESIIVEVVSITDVPGQTVEVTPEYTAECVRQITVSFQLSDACGNVQPTLFVCIYNIIDDNAPSVFCPDGGGPSLPEDCYPNVAAAQAAALEAIDPCDNCTEFDDLDISVSTIGTCNAEVTVTVADCAGNESTVTFYTRIDGDAPEMTVSDIPNCYPSLAAAQAAAIAGTTITDNCDPYGNLTITATTMGTCPATVTVTATDQCGNSRSVSYPGICIGVSSEVVISPEASNLNVDCDTWQADLAAWLADHGGAEATGSGIVWTYLPLDPQTVLQMSAPNCTTHTKSVVVTFRATNDCENFDETTATFSVTDLVPPTANSIPNTNLTCSTAIPAPNVAIVTGEADNCGDTPTVGVFATSDNMASGCPGTPRIIIHQYIVTDAYCNTALVNHMITVVDNVPPNFTAPANITINVNAACVYNASTAITGDVLDESDNCTASGPMLQAYYTDVVNSGVNFQERYIITRTWNLTDACGNSAIPRVQTITVLDVTPPTLTGCPTNKSFAGTLSGEDCGATASPALEIPSFGDNCPDVAISYELTGATGGSGTGFVPGATVFLEGVTTVTYTVTDAVGNTITCSFTVTVNCLTIAGRIIWEHDDVSGVKDATVKLSQGMVSLGSDLSDTNGDYELTVPAAGLFRVTPVKNINRLNGVTTADATRITNHVNFSNPILDPYKKVCADVNRSGIINTQDATLITQCLMGNPTALAIFNVFWRFTPTDYVMPGTAHQNVPAFPEFKDVTVTTLDVTGVNFFGMKIGDVDAVWADPQMTPNIPPLVWVLQDQTLVAGTEVEVTFAASNFYDLASYQMALDFDPTQLQFVGFQPLGAIPMNLLDNFGAYNANLGELRNAWALGTGTTLADGTPVFRAKFKVLASGQKLSQVLKLDDSELPCKAYSEALVPTDVKLLFTESVSTGTPLDLGKLQLQLMQNRPNPFADATTIGFILPEACDAHIRILDISGRELTSYDRQYTAGYHELEFRMENAWSYGVLFCELVTPQGKRTIKMITAK
ncbi:MAG: PKD-like domain-containing protein [Saprospiraceae bacterium]